MAKVSADRAQVNARIVYWGIEGAGKRTSLETVQAKLRADHRGQIQDIPTRLDPAESYTVLPISLGEIAGMRTQIELISTPGTPAQAPTRKQLLDEVDGIVFLVDCQPEKLEENAAILDELRKGLDDYARDLEDLPLVVQYNKRDLCDDYGIDELHRRFGLGGATVFESVATDGTGVLQTLSTISKKVIRTLRGESLEGGPAMQDQDKPEGAELNAAPLDTAPEPVLEEPAVLARDALEPRDGETAGPPLEVSTVDFEEAILAEEASGAELDSEVQAAQGLLEQPWHHAADALDPPLGARIGPELSIVSVGEATRADDRSVRLPLVLGDRDGETSTLVLTLRLDPVVDETD